MIGWLLSAGTQVTNHLENPPINPIVGHGRTSTDVQRERETYQREVREQADAHGGEAPVFQADFIFVRVPHKGVQLHRVAHGLFIEDAVQSELSFTTAEYNHVPQEVVDGFWGHFEPALNGAFDPNDKTTGTKFARHHNVGRDSIVLYNVQVWCGNEQ